MSRRSDRVREFENEYFKTFFDENGIAHNFSYARIPQQKGFAERKNRTLQKMTRTLLDEANIKKYS